MINSPDTNHQIQEVNNFQDLVSTPFHGAINAICWTRTLTGNFSEIVNKLTPTDNITVIDQEELHKLQLSEQGQLARDRILQDWQLLTNQGAAPVLNLIKYYDRDEANSFFPTDVYSFHADRSPVPTDTFLCTYHGAPSEILPNAQAQQKVLIPEIRNALKKRYDGAEEYFELFLSDHFYDLHYQATTNAQPISLGVGNLWKLAIDHPQSQVPPCIHRAPQEKTGQHRLLLIC